MKFLDSSKMTLINQRRNEPLNERCEASLARSFRKYAYNNAPCRKKLSHAQQSAAAIESARRVQVRAASSSIRLPFKSYSPAMHRAIVKNLTHRISTGHYANDRALRPNHGRQKKSPSTKVCIALDPRALRFSRFDAAR